MMNTCLFQSRSSAARLAAVAFIVLATVSASSAEFKASCPQQIAEDSWRPVSTPDKWIGYMPKAMQLQTGGMMSGPPASREMLAPHRQEQGAKSFTMWFVFMPGNGERWLYCDYSGTHSIQLYRRIDDAVTECRAIFVGDNPLRELNFVCK
jgi:hypothetical protein